MTFERFDELAVAFMRNAVKQSHSWKVGTIYVDSNGDWYSYMNYGHDEYLSYKGEVWERSFNPNTISYTIKKL